MELIIKNKLDVLKNVEANFDEIKKTLEVKLDKYKSLVYNDEQIGEAKKDKADLNKMIKEIEEKRKEVKKIIMLPYDSFELKIKELVELIKSPINEIDAQVKKYEEQAKKEKREAIENLFTSIVGDCELQLNRIFSDKWLNASTTLKVIEGEIRGHIGYFNRDMEVIVNLQSKHFEQLKKMYLDTYDLGLVMSEKNKLDEAEKTVIEAQKKEAEKKAIEVEQAKEIIVEAPKKEDGMVSFTIKITTDKERMQLLKDFIVFNQISYERIN
jgi:hypothetical protein